MSNIGRKILKEEKNMTLERLYDEVSKRIIREYESGVVLSDNEVRRITYKWLKMVILLEKVMGRHQVKVIKDESQPVDRPKLYTFTTGGNNDLKTAFTLIKNPGWLPVLKPQFYGDFETFLYRHHFITWYDESDEKLKEALRDKQRKILLSGEDLICFPEIKRCGLDKEMSLNIEYADIIVHTNPVIVPIALQEYTSDRGTICYANIGKNFDLYGLREEFESEILIIVREELKRLKGQIIDYTQGKGNIKESNREIDSDRYLLMKR